MGQHRVPSLLMWGQQDQAVPFSPNFDRWKVGAPSHQASGAGCVMEGESLGRESGWMVA